MRDGIVYRNAKKPSRAAQTMKPTVIGAINRKGRRFRFCDSHIQQKMKTPGDDTGGKYPYNKVE
jgi:hypothetical protein